MTENVEAFARPSSSETSPVNAPMPNDPNDHPKKMVVREIDFTLIDGKLKFYYTQAWGPYAVPDRNALETAVTLLAEGKPVPGLMKNKMSMKGDLHSWLSLSSPDYRYVVLVLAATKSWQFAQTGVPITISTATKGKDIYYDARRVSRRWGIKQVGPGITEPLDECRVAFLAIRGGRGPADPLDPLAYPHPFNLYIDLYDDVDGSVTPIIVDPDIRYPGGNTLTDPPE